MTMARKMRRTSGATHRTMGKENSHDVSQADGQLPKKIGTKPMLMSVAKPETKHDIMPDKMNPKAITLYFFGINGITSLRSTASLRRGTELIVGTGGKGFLLHLLRFSSQVAENGRRKSLVALSACLHFAVISKRVPAIPSFFAE